MKQSHIVLLFLIAAGVALVATQMENFSSYVNFDQARSGKGKDVQGLGDPRQRTADPLRTEVDPNAFSFWMRDREGDEVKVVCVDEKPIDFELSDEVELTGAMRDSIFYANSIRVKCPSKYVDDESRQILAW